VLAASLSLGITGLADGSALAWDHGALSTTLTASNPYPTAADQAGSLTPQYVVGSGGPNPAGFDKCSPLTEPQMSELWSTGHYGWVGVYVGGQDAYCQDFPHAGWFNTIESQGWYVEPIWVGPQSQCSGYSAFSNNPSTAYSQGQQQAHLAYTALQEDGFDVSGGEVPVVYDLERFKPRTIGCRLAAEQFIKGWDATLPRQLPGVYGSVGSSNRSAKSSFIQNLTGAPAPAFIWGADWNTTPNTADLLPIPNGDWNNSQRLKQYQGNVSISVSGGPEMVDLDEADGPLYSNY